jgi:septal ring factor EnvC (AmiA/AmiB activator)
MDSHEPTLGELVRRQERLEMRLDERVVSLSTYRAEREADQSRVKALEIELTRLSERLTWAYRLAATAILTAVVQFGIQLLTSAGGTP